MLADSKHQLTHLWVTLFRFMQQQPLLIELGLARLELLKRICLPTLQQQTSQNFLWIIRADPDLAEPIKKGLLDILQNATQATPEFHVVVVGTNDNPNGFRRPLPETAEQVWTNNFELLEHFHEASQSRVVLETRLDADDGLHTYFVEVMQEEAVQYLDDEDTPNWIVWCAGTHVEWQYGTPWEFPFDAKSSVMLDGTKPKDAANLTRSSSASAKTQNTTSTHTLHQQPKNSSFGSLLPGLTRGCITPGLTKGYSPEVQFEELPDAQHHQLHWKLRTCKDDSPDWHQCLVIWNQLIPCAIRGRTPTSAGMQFVLGSHTSYLSSKAQDLVGLEDPDDLYSKQERMWSVVVRYFLIPKESMAQLRSYLTQHLHAIAEENLLGQCTKGHSCKNSSQIILKELLGETVQQQNASMTADSLPALAT